MTVCHRVPRAPSPEMSTSSHLPRTPEARHSCMPQARVPPQVAQHRTPHPQAPVGNAKPLQRVAPSALRPSRPTRANPWMHTLRSSTLHLWGWPIPSHRERTVFPRQPQRMACLGVAARHHPPAQAICRKRVKSHYGLCDATFHSSSQKIRNCHAKSVPTGQYPACISCAERLSSTQ